MRHRVNLFSSRAETTPLSKKMARYRLVSVLVGLALLFGLVLSVGIYAYADYRLKAVDTSSQSTQRYIQKYDAFSTQIAQFVEQYAAFQTYLAADVYGYQYLTRLQALFQNTQVVETLDSFMVGADRDTNFTVSFSSYEDAISFLTEVESAPFAETFQSLSMDSFSVIANNDEQYTLSFSGEFAPIPESSL